MKKCHKCNRRKRITSFTNDRSRPDGKDYWCRDCKNKLGKKYRKTPRAKELANKRATRWRKENRNRVRNNQLKRDYGIDLKTKRDIFRRQGRKCRICKRKKVGYLKWVIDHDHKTKKVRGVLCNRCNLLLGRAKDSIKILLSAVKYLRKK